MATTPAPNPRASLLSGLRTGGVRATSASHNFPQSAAPGASFNVPRFSSQSYTNNANNNNFGTYYTQEDELADMVSQNLYIHSQPPRAHQQYQPPMTAAIDGSNRLSQQQFARNMSGGMSMQQAAEANRQAQQQAMQMQMIQLEMMRLQALQNQQYQAELLVQAQRQQQQQQQQQQNARTYSNIPATAGPANSTFEIRSAALSAQNRRANQADQLRARLGLAGANNDIQGPMTADIGGRFGARTTVSGHVTEEDILAVNDGSRAYQMPQSAKTTVISGGTSLGTPVTSTSTSTSNVSPTLGASKSDTAVSWRRGGNNNSVLNGANRSTSISVKITPPPSSNGDSAPSSALSPLRTRPQPLQFSVAVSQPLSSVAIDESADEGDESSVTSVSASSKSAAGSSGRSPTTPDSASSSTTSAEQPLSPREEATKKLYEGLGIGRPVANGSAGAAASLGSVSTAMQNGAGATQRVISCQPLRQPRGPPSGADELGPKNFATRIRRKAIGGLGALMGARERREVVVEAF